MDAERIRKEGAIARGRAREAQEVVRKAIRGGGGLPRFFNVPEILERAAWHDEIYGVSGAVRVTVIDDSAHTRRKPVPEKLSEEEYRLVAEGIRDTEPFKNLGVFAGVRAAVAKRSAFLGEGISCHYCVSHWMAFVSVAVLGPYLTTPGTHFAVRWLAVPMALVAASALLSGVVLRALQVRADMEMERQLITAHKHIIALSEELRKARGWKQ